MNVAKSTDKDIWGGRNQLGVTWGGDGWILVFLSNTSSFRPPPTWVIFYDSLRQEKLRDPAGGGGGGGRAGRASIKQAWPTCSHTLCGQALGKRGGLEMWRRNQYSVIHAPPPHTHTYTHHGKKKKGGRAEWPGSWKRRAGGECWQQQTTAMLLSFFFFMDAFTKNASVSTSWAELIFMKQQCGGGASQIHSLRSETLKIIAYRFRSVDMRSHSSILHFLIVRPWKIKCKFFVRFKDLNIWSFYLFLYFIFIYIKNNKIYIYIYILLYIIYIYLYIILL